MANPIKRGESGSQVNSWAQNDRATDYGFASTILPYGLQLRQTINAGTTSVTIPAGITWVYAIAVGGGGGGFSASAGASGGGAGGISWGWTLSNSTCIVGTGGNNASGGYTRYGSIIAGGGGSPYAVPQGPGGAGGGGY